MDTQRSSLVRLEQIVLLNYLLITHVVFYQTLVENISPHTSCVFSEIRGGMNQTQVVVVFDQECILCR